MLKDIALAFIPIFVTVDAIGVLPIFVSLTQGLDRQEKSKIIFQSVLTATSVAIGFIFLGKAVFRFLGITIGDFMIAGGTILFCIAIMDLLLPGKQRRRPSENPGAVPIGTPLIVGPAVLTSILIIMDIYGFTITLFAVIPNILLAGVIFFFSDKLLAIIGQTGTRALSKIMALFLAAIGVKMIRKGLTIC